MSAVGGRGLESRNRLRLLPLTGYEGRHCARTQTDDEETDAAGVQGLKQRAFSGRKCEVVHVGVPPEGVRPGSVRGSAARGTGRRDRGGDPRVRARAHAPSAGGSFQLSPVGRQSDRPFRYYRPSPGHRALCFARRPCLLPFGLGALPFQGAPKGSYSVSVWADSAVSTRNPDAPDVSSIAPVQKAHTANAEIR
jgi:hypothetical protein